jgi:murein DD-endopeptidase
MWRLRGFEVKWLFVWAMLAVFLAHTRAAQPHSGFPVNIVAGPRPQLVMADGRGHLLYELHVTNVAPIPIEVVALEIFGDDGAALSKYGTEELRKDLVPAENLLVSVAPTDRGDKPGQIGDGHEAVIFVDLTLEAGARAPMELRHRFTFDIKGNAALERTVNGPVVAVVQEPIPVLHAPLKGSGWIAFNALGAYDHRRAYDPVDGRLRIAQRFAIDWMRLGADGRAYHDDTKSNTNFYGYGAEVLAVAEARVSDLRDGVPDNGGATERSSRVVTVDSAVGNYVILDLGGGRFALYAHLQPGSLKVKVGDHVNVGQPLALLGNSGNSDEPHLHFHLTEGNSPLGSEGVPYELERFTQLGIVSDEDALEHGQAWQAQAQERPVVRQREFPINKAVVNFP